MLNIPGNIVQPEHEQGFSLSLSQRSCLVKAQLKQS